MLGDQLLELANELGMTAKREVGVDPLLQRNEPEILEPPRLDAGEVVIRELT